MMNVDYRPNKHVHDAGLTRLSARQNMGLANLEISRTVCFSFAAYARSVIEHLSKCQIPISTGLSNEEFFQIEKKYGFNFPPDLKSILQEGLPVGAGFPDWRSGSEQQLRMMLTLPMVGLCYEIARERFWWKQWGCKPADTGVALQIARKAFEKAPVLIPIYSHCYIPGNPNIAGNPVFFVYEKDIFCCGYDLADFFAREAFVPHGFNSTSDVDKEETGNTEMKSVNKGRKKKYGQNDIHLDFVSREQSAVEISVSSRRWKSEMKDTKNGEVSARKSVGKAHPQSLKKPEAHVGSAGSSPRMDGYVVSRYMYFHKRPLPMEIQTQFTMAAPTWAAKTARYIQVWSDLVEDQESLSLIPTESQSPAFKLGVDNRKSVEKKVESKEVGMVEFEGSRSGKRWLLSYFDDMGKRLRKGGWKEDEVTEMMESVLPKEQRMLATRNGYGLLDALTLQVDILSASLRKAGWSAQDVLEVLHFDISDMKQQRFVSKIVPAAAATTSPLSS